MVSRFVWFDDGGPRRSGACTAVVDLGAYETRVSLLDDEGGALALVHGPSCGIADDGSIIPIPELPFSIHK